MPEGSEIVRAALTLLRSSPQTWDPLTRQTQPSINYRAFILELYPFHLFCDLESCGLDGPPCRTPRQQGRVRVV